MAETARPRRALQPHRDPYRRSLLTVAWLTVVLAALHLADHALRGARVHSHALDPNWDHSGWPFKPEVAEANDETQPSSVPVFPGRFTRSRGLGAGRVVGGAQLLLELAELRKVEKSCEPQPLNFHAQSTARRLRINRPSNGRKPS
jgi:hypothetical protein